MCECVSVCVCTGFCCLRDKICLTNLGMTEVLPICRCFNEDTAYVPRNSKGLKKLLNGVFF